MENKFEYIMEDENKYKTKVNWNKLIEEDSDEEVDFKNIPGRCSESKLKNTKKINLISRKQKNKWEKLNK